MTQTSTAAKRPRTASREVRRSQLIEATIESIARHGLTGTTMATVTGLADLSMGIVSFHFQSKENLLRDTLVHLAEEHRAAWIDGLAESGLAPAAKLARLIDAHFHPSICNHRRIAVWFAFFGEARYREVYRAHIAAYDTERTEILTDLCERLICDGGYGAVSASDVTGTLESLADGLWLSVLLYPDWLSREDAKRQIHAYLAGVFPREFATWPGAAP